MSDALLVMTPDGMMEFDGSEIETFAIEESGVRVLLKTGMGFFLVGYEAAALLERLADAVIKSVVGAEGSR